jgi:hypothetical protein
MKAVRDFLLAPPAGAALDRAPRGGPRPRAGNAGRAATPRAATASTAAPAAVALLCAADDARALGVAAASLLGRRSGAGCGLACIWTAPEPHRHPDPQAPASRAARRLTAALAGRGLDAQACGRAATVALPADPAHAVAAAARAAAAAGDAPVVLALGGPRAAAFDELLAEQDRLVVVTPPGGDATIGPLALAGLPVATGRVHTIGLSRAGRALAAAGLAVPARLRDALDPRTAEGA